MTSNHASLLDAQAMIAKCRELLGGAPVSQRCSATSGNYAHSATSGYNAHSATSGNYAHSATSGYNAHSATSGNDAHSATSGNGAHSATSGNYAHSATSGYNAHSATSGNDAHSATSGNGAHSATSGNGAHSATSGYRAHSATSGYRAHSATSGNNAHALSAQGAAESAKAIAVGRWVRLGPDTLEAVILPAEGFRTVTIAADVIDSTEGEPWPVGVWITMNDSGVVVTRPDVLLPNDGRNYQLVWTGKSYVAGCRSFTYAEAVKHWGNPDHKSPVSARMLLAEVERHHASQVTA
jgi:hypothetical protein